MKLSEYARYDALGLAALVHEGQVTRRQLAQCALDAIAALNPQLNAVIETWPARLEQLQEGKASAGAFDGVPFLLKDIGAHDAGVRYEAGSRLARGLRVLHMSELVRRFRGSGVTLLGRTNVPEMASSCSTEPLLYGPTHNPWDLARSPGGSSGGSAAAVAAGLVPLAHANDGGGSIRIPASFCGLVGLKPSRNLNPVGPDSALPLLGLAVEHIVSRSVRDSAAMLDATAGPGVGEFCFTPRSADSYLAELRRPPGRLRIALNVDPDVSGAVVAPEVLRATEAIAKFCHDLGHEVQVARYVLDKDASVEHMAVLWAAASVQSIDAIAAMTARTPGSDTLEPHVLAGYEFGRQLSAAQLMRALDYLNVVARAVGAFFSRHDVLLTPTMPSAAFKLGHVATVPASPYPEHMIAMMRLSPFTAIINMAGVPAISLPLCQHDGLPIGMSFSAALGQEPLLLRLAAQLEEALPWAGRTPPVFAGNAI